MRSCLGVLQKHLLQPPGFSMFEHLDVTVLRHQSHHSSAHSFQRQTGQLQLLRSYHQPLQWSCNVEWVPWMPVACAHGRSQRWRPADGPCFVTPQRFLLFLPFRNFHPPRHPAWPGAVLLHRHPVVAGPQLWQQQLWRGQQDVRPHTQPLQVGPNGYSNTLQGNYKASFIEWALGVTGLNGQQASNAADHW